MTIMTASGLTDAPVQVVGRELTEAEADAFWDSVMKDANDSAGANTANAPAAAAAKAAPKPPKPSPKPAAKAVAKRKRKEGAFASRNLCARVGSMIGKKIHVVRSVLQALSTVAAEGLAAKKPVVLPNFVTLRAKPVKKKEGKMVYCALLKKYVPKKAVPDGKIKIVADIKPGFKKMVEHETKQRASEGRAAAVGAVASAPAAAPA